VRGAQEDVLVASNDEARTQGHGNTARSTRDAVIPRRVELRTGAICRNYVSRLSHALRRAGAFLRITPSSARLPETLDWLLYFESLAYRARGESFRAESVAASPDFSEAADLVVDLAGDAPDAAAPTLRLRFAGGFGEGGLVATLLDGAPLAVDLILTSSKAPPRVVDHALLAVENPAVLAVALDSSLARLATLIAKAIGCSADDDVAMDLQDDGAGGPTALQPLAFGALNLASKIADRLTQRVKVAGHWRIATRRIEGESTWDRLAWPAASWSILPDDGLRYYADPFLVERDGKRYLFCEEYPYATAKGILSVAEIGDDGRPGSMRPFLETASHLSWPNIFVHDDAIYMIPESAGANRIELWRAVDFPSRWVLDRVLIDGIRAHDPVLHVDDGGAHLLATVDDDGGSNWDALCLFHAAGLFEPWRADARNPLFVDAGAARPAGPIVARADGLWRAAQDCRSGYGAGIALCRVTQFDARGYAQDVAARLGPPVRGAQGVHSLSQAGELEAIDLRGDVTDGTFRS
jgi:hypothetical protein